MPAIELEPCPFCGEQATFDHDDNGWNWIVCTSCEASTNSRVSAMDDCKPILAESWNRRMIDKDLKAKSEALCGLAKEALDGGWTYAGMNEYAKALETKLDKLIIELRHLITTRIGAESIREGIQKAVRNAKG